MPTDTATDNNAMSGLIDRTSGWGGPGASGANSGSGSAGGSGAGGSGGNGGSGGLASKLVSMAIDQKAAQEKKAALAPLSAARLVMQTYERDPDAVDPEMLQWSLSTLSDIDKVMQGQSLGGGKGKGDGKGGGVKGKLGGIGSLLANMITGGLSGTMQANSRRRSGMAEAERRAGASMPQGKTLTLTPEERQKLEATQAEAAAAEKLKIQEAEDTYKRKANQQVYEQELDRLIEAGLDPIRAAEEANAIAAGRSIPAASRTAAAAPAKKQTAAEIAHQAYADKHGLDASKLTAEQKIKAVQEAKPTGRASANAAGADPEVKFTDNELRSQARLSLITKHDPNFGTRNPKLTARFGAIKAEEIEKMGGPQAVAAAQAKYAGETHNLSGLLRLQSQMRAAKSGTDLEIDRLKRLSNSVDLDSVARYNSFEQFLSANLTDNPDLARFREALVAARYRYNSMISSFRSSGGSATNQVRSETAEEIINRSMARGALNAAADEMKVGLQNVMSGLDQAVVSTENELSGKVSADKPNAASASGVKVKVWDDKQGKFVEAK
jgi:hypothetical protein